MTARSVAEHTDVVKAAVFGDVQLEDDRGRALLRSVGLRVTQPRLAVLRRVLSAGEEHLSADELLEQVHAEGVHRATVYRTLEGLTEAGVLSHVHLDRGLTAYHLADPGSRRHDGHLHAQCSQCGAVVDLPPDVLGDAPERVRKASGFVLDPAHVALSGLCADCVGAAAD